MADWHPFIETTGLDKVEYESLTPVYEEALRREPEDLDTLAWLGQAYTCLGRIEEGLTVDLRLTALLPRDPTARYNLACSLALLGRADESLSTLREAVRLGYADHDHMAADKDLASLHGDARFTALLRSLAVE